jgi:hypothetical protein
MLNALRSEATLKAKEHYSEIARKLAEEDGLLSR